MTGKTVLVVDDDPELRELIALYLRDHRFVTVEAGDGPEAIRLFRSHRPDLVLLDVLMPDMDGYETARRIRGESRVPIIFLTSKMEASEMVSGLEIADDYVTKPFVPEVLIARVNAQLRRTETGRPATVIAFNQLAIHLDADTALFRGNEIPLLAKEFKLLKFFAERPRQLFDAEQLYEHLWTFGEGDARTVMVHISNLRKKLAIHAPDSVHIETVKGLGYRLVPVESHSGGSPKPMMQEAIVEAATALFAERGYEGMTMKEIARKVGISASSIYSVFKNKEELFLQIYRQVLDNHLQLAVSAASFDHAPDIKSRFDELIDTIIRFQLNDADKMRIYVRMLLLSGHQVGLETRKQLMKLEEEEEALFTEWIEAGMAQGEFRREDSRAWAMMLICLLDGFFWQMQRHPEEAFMARFEVVWAKFWEMLKG